MERAESQLFRDIVDRLEHGVVIVADDMRILYANAAAESLLREGVVVFTSGGRLGVRFPQAQAALARAVSLGMADEISLGTSGIDIPLGVTSRPAVAHALPLSRRPVSDRIKNAAAAAIFIAAAGTVVQTAIEAIAALFGLTMTEKRIAGYISDGLTRHEIAQAQGVTDGTVKSQLAAIFDKTGAGGQRGLQSLMKELTTAVRRASSPPRSTGV
jgi:DNA-binding CsgD family transcriptional regulator